MITKKTTPILSEKKGTQKQNVVGTKSDYRFFGILFYRKTLLTPEKYGITGYEHFQTRI